jgi:Thiopurine S-methyltransferase (TPMT).
LPRATDHPGIPAGGKGRPAVPVEEAEVRGLFEPDWQVDLLERRDILDQEPGFRAEGVTALATAVYRLQRL